MRILEKRQAVSHIIGYVLTLSLMAMVVAAALLMTNGVIEDKTRSAAELYAKDLANRVADAVVNVCLMKEQYPNANYSMTLEIPLQLINRYPYYIKLDNHNVYVNTTDGQVKSKSTIYGAAKMLSMDMTGIIQGSNKLIAYCNRTDYIHAFDFGTNRSSGNLGYTRITDNCTNGNWHFDSMKYRTPIKINNPTGSAVNNYQILIQLSDANFDHSLVNNNGSDLRFVDSSGSEQKYWIERWYLKDTKTSRVWVNVTDVPEGYSTIYMYHGDISASPNSNGEDTFIFFDDFKQDLSKWNIYSPLGATVGITNDMLVLTNKAAVTSKAPYLQPASEPCIIEAKAKAVGSAIREASMFVRSSDSGAGVDPPYEKGHVFSSGCFPSMGNNLTILYYPGGLQTNATAANDTSPVDEEWNRLRYILNGNDDVICRYFYESFLADDHAAADFGVCDDGFFGLCTVNPTYTTIAQYDWVFVRKFAARTDLTGGGREDAEPMAYVDGTQSRDYMWLNPDEVTSSSSGGTELGADFVCSPIGSADPAIFRIMNLTAGRYSMTFIIGDKFETVDNMEIRIDGGLEPLSISNIDCSPYEKIWRSDIEVDFSGVLDITFEDMDSSGSDYWAVGEMTIEKGERAVKIKGVLG